MIAGWACRRLRREDFFSRMWLVKALRPRSLPEPVMRKRFFVPEWVFIFGMVGRLVNQTPGGEPGSDRR
jgi:hypothetical protein